MHATIFYSPLDDRSGHLFFLLQDLSVTEVSVVADEVYIRLLSADEPIDIVELTAIAVTDEDSWLALLR